MKRNLFAILLALTLVVALAFVVAPTAKAAGTPDKVLTADETFTVDSDMLLDLAGHNATVTLKDNAVLSVIDSANKGITGVGDNVGTLKYTGDGSIALTAVDASVGNRSFLRLENTDGSFSFHPYYMTVKQIGVNTNKGVLCLQAMFVTNEVAQKAIKTGIIYTDKDGKEVPVSTGNYAFGTEGKEQGVLYAYYDLTDSLIKTDENGNEVVGVAPDGFETPKTFKAYISVKDVENGTISREVTTAFSPAEVLKNLDDQADSFKENGLADKMVNFIKDRKHLADLCPKFLGKQPEAEPAWTLVTDASTLTAGDQIVITNKDGSYAIGTNQKSSNRGAAAVTKSGNVITFGDDVEVITLAAGNVADTFAFKVSGGYLYTASSSGNQLKTQTTNNANGSWKVTIADGVASITAPNSTNRNVMQYNPNNGSPLFACYSSASQTALAIYKWSGDSTTPDVPDVTDPPVTEPETPPVTPTTPEEILKAAYALEAGATLDGTYSLTGEVTKIDTAYNSQYSNVSVVIQVEGFSDMPMLCFRMKGEGADKVAVGDIITVTGTIKNYNGTIEFDAGCTFVMVTAHTHNYEAVVTAPTCTANGYTTHTCSICGDFYKDAEVDALGHTTENGECGNCGQTIGGTTPAQPTTVSVVIKDYASANGWSNSIKYTSLTMDSNITVTVAGGGNTGKYYTSGTNWRIYQNESPKITVTATNGKTITSVKITYTVDKTGVLTLNGSNITSNTAVSVNSNSVTFGVGNTSPSVTNGQVRITAIEVIYQ